MPTLWAENQKSNMNADAERLRYQFDCILIKSDLTLINTIVLINATSMHIHVHNTNTKIYYCTKIST